MQRFIVKTWLSQTVDGCKIDFCGTFKKDFPFFILSLHVFLQTFKKCLYEEHFLLRFNIRIKQLAVDFKYLKKVSETVM